MKQNTWQVLENAVLETLEGRQMMSAAPLGTVSLNNGVLSVKGDAKLPTNIIIDYHNGGSLLHVHAGQTEQSFAIEQVKKLQITSGSGNDYIYIDPRMSIPADIHSGDGNDSIHGGGGNDSIDAGAGDDAVNGKGGNDSIDGGAGNDLLWGETGNDSINGGDGNDAIAGGVGNDQIHGDTGSDRLYGEAGNDVINSGGGATYAAGGLGDDTLQGSASSDTLMGNSGDNTIDATTPQVGTPGTAPITGPTTDPTSGLPTGPTAGGGNTDTSGGTATSGGTDTSGGTATSGGTDTSGGAATSGDTDTSGGTATGNGGTTDTTGDGGGTTTVSNPDAPLPAPVIKVLDGIRETGLVVNVDALSSTLAVGTPLTAKFEWDFGDQNTRFDQLVGYNAAHVYDTPGTYTVKLTVTNEQGGVASTSVSVTVAASSRTQFFVDPVNGNDSNIGSQALPYKSLDRAFLKVNANTEILLKAGSTFSLKDSLHINQHNVVVTRYGSGADPTIVRTQGNGLSTINIYAASDGVTIEHITFDTPYGVSASDQAPKVSVSGIYPGGKNNTVRNCTFKNLDDAINLNSKPTGVLIQDNTAPLDTGLRGYFIWGMGSEQVYVGNTVANSTREHCVRMVDTNEVLIANNNFNNQDRRSVDPYDYSKGTIEMHRGSYTYVTHNDIKGGNIRTGPLGIWGESPTTSTEWNVIEDNQLTGTRIYVKAGSHHIMLRGNVVAWDAQKAIAIDGPDSAGRIVSDVTIENNTAIDNATSGNFLTVAGHATGIVLKNNLWIAPNLTPGGWGAAAVYVADNNLSGFSEIANNIWPSPSKISDYAQGGINYIGTSYNAAGYQTPGEWNSQSQVKNDVFENVTLDSSYQILLAGLKVGSAMKMAA